MYGVVPTAFGALAVVLGPEPGRAEVLRSGFLPLGDLLAELPQASALSPWAGNEPEVVGLIRAVAEWSDGTRLGALSEVPVRLAGSGFRRRAWTQLHAVPPGRVVTYGELAALAGSPLAARAAGGACASNPLAPFVPCHRVVPAGGGTGSYGYGKEMKAAMLAHEGVDL